MKVLLCIPVIKGSYQATPDIGLGYLATALLRAGHEVKIIDSVNLGLDYSGFRSILLEEKPQVLGIKVFSRDIVSAKKCLEIARETCGNIVTAIGGPHPSTASPEESLDFFVEADYAFRGESDIGFPLLLQKISKGETALRDLEEVPGLIFRMDGKIHVNTQQFIQDLDSLGMPAWKLMDPRSYKSKEAYGFYIDKFPAAYIIATRGCPYQCSFCASHLITGRKVRYRSVGNVIGEIKMLKEKFGVKVINIVDDNIALNKDYIMEFCDAIIKEKINLDWHCPYGVRLDSLDPDIIRKMEESGCKSIAVGIESGDNEILMHMKKKLTVEKVEEKVRMIKENSRIHIHGNFMVGYPTETVETVKKTIQFARKLPIDVAAFAPFRPTPGTPIFHEMLADGMIKDVKWGGFLVDDVIFSPPKISQKELKKLWRRAYFEFYTQPRVIWGFMKSVRSVHQVKWLLRRVRNRFFNF